MKSFFIKCVLFALFSVACAHNFLEINSKYYVSQDQEEFLMAAINCKVNGWTFVTITNQAENDSLNDTLNALGVQDLPMWVGGIRSGDSMYWLETGDHANYTNWAPTEPDCPSAAASCCLLFNQKGGGFWYLYTCDTKQYYVCQKL